MMKKCIYFIMLILLTACDKEDEVKSLIYNPSEFKVILTNVGFNSANLRIDDSSIEDKTILLYDVYLNGSILIKDLKQKTCKLEKLNAETDYKIKVVAKSIYNTETNSSIDFLTLSYPIPKKINLKQDKVTSDCITVSWNKSVSSEILVYDIYLNNIIKAKDMECLTYSFTSLDADSSYKIKVIAKNKYGKKNSSELETKTLNGPIDFVIEISDICKNGVTVSWKTSFVEKFGFIYKICLNGKEIKIHNSGSERFEGLVANTLYEVKITCTKLFSETIIIKEKSFKTLSESTLSDFTLSFESVRPNSVFLKWTSCIASNGMEVRYDVYDSQGRLYSKDLSKSDLLIESLKPEQECTFIVKAHSLDASLIKEKEISFTTLSESNLSDFALSVESVWSNSVFLKWTSCIASNGMEVRYDVYDSQGRLYSKDLSKSDLLIESLKPEQECTFIVKAHSLDASLIKEKRITFMTHAEYELSYKLSQITTNSILFNCDMADTDYFELLENNKSLYKGKSSRFIVHDLKSDTQHSFNLIAKGFNGKIYNKEIIVETKAYPEADNFNIRVCGFYNNVSIQLNDFYNKNRDKYPDIDYMIIEYYLNGEKFTRIIAEQWSVNHLKPDMKYTLRMIIKHKDETLVVDRTIDFNTAKNFPPIWNNVLRLSSSGFGCAEFENISATDLEIDSRVLKYRYYINGEEITACMRTIGNGQVKRGVNDNGKSIIINNLEVNKEYDFYIVAEDKDGGIATTNHVRFRTSS